MKKLNLLLSAYACVPGRGSEPGVGWNLAVALSKYHNVWVVTQADKKPFIEREIKRNPNSNLQFIYYDLPFWKIKLIKNGIQIYYYLWHVFGARHVQKWCAEHSIDIAHHITMVRYWSPCILRNSPVPFVWGPVGGGEFIPPQLSQSLGVKERIKEWFRMFVQCSAHWDPFVKKTVKEARVCFVTTQQTRERIEQVHKRACVEYSEAGLSVADIEKLSEIIDPSVGSFRFISMGRLLSWKGFHLGLRAFAEAKIPDSEYWVCGDGPQRKFLEDLSCSLGIADKVKFLGKLPRDEALSKLKSSHALVHPSLHDSGGWVCLEAMASRRPVICLDWGGPGVQVQETTGIKVVPASEKETVQRLANAMSKLWNEQQHLNDMGEACLSHVLDNFLWDNKAKYLTEVYLEILK